MRTSIWSRLLDVIAPRQCAICGRRLEASQLLLCAPCHLHLPLTRYWLSPLDNPMARRLWGLVPVERAAALFFYEPQAGTSHMIFDMKYHGHRETCEAAGEVMARMMAPSGFFDGIDALVPVPLTRRRQWQRGYNQSHELARGIAHVTGLPVYAKALRRTRFGQSQTGLNAWERTANVTAAFALRQAERCAGKHLLLVDDIVTTGATMTACATELLRLPGVSVSILSLGVTRP